jgi:hypothetical protein
MMRCLPFCLLWLAVPIEGARGQADTVCAGTPAEPARRLALKTGPAASAPYADLTVDGITGPWLLDYGATATSVSHHGPLDPRDPRWTGPAHEKLRLSGFSMPFAGTGPREFWYYPRDMRLPGVGVQRGVVGTDIFKDVTAEFHFEDAGDAHVLFSRGRCVAPAGFWRISQEGYFGTRPRVRAPYIPNVPVVFIEFEAFDGTLAGARAFAQLDPGFDDLIWRYSVGVNERLFTRLESLAPAPVKVGEIPTRNCGNQDVRRPVYVLPGQRLRIEDEHQGWMTKFEAIYIIRIEDEPPGTCNGIGTMPEPAAVLGASFLRAFGTTVIVPEARRDANGFSIGEMWIRMPRQPQQIP